MARTIVFSDPDTYETVTLAPEIVGDGKNYLVENAQVTVTFVEEKAVTIELPSSVVLKVADAPEGVRGDSANNVQKADRHGNGHHRPGPALHQDRREDQGGYPHREVHGTGLSLRPGTKTGLQLSERLTPRPRPAPTGGETVRRAVRRRGCRRGKTCNTNHRIMKRILVAAMGVMTAAPLLAADANPAGALSDAIAKLKAEPNYSWTVKVELPGMGFTPEPMEGKTEKDGFMLVTQDMNGAAVEAAFKGDKAVLNSRTPGRPGIPRTRPVSTAGGWPTPKAARMKRPTC